jgi:hypothetical protein
MRRIAAFVLAVAAFALAAAAATEDPLPSWRDGDAKGAIREFVTAVSDPSGPEYVPQAERIAIFDNDGTLWAEQPVYFQFLFAIDMAKARAAADRAWAATPTLQAAASGDVEGVLAGGKAALLELVTATHSGMSTESFTAEAAAWLAEARHPVSGRPFPDMVYAPMLELLDHLRANGFSVYIVSGGGIDFMRGFAEAVYGVPPQNVIGSLGEASLQIVDGVPQVIKHPGIAFVDDGAGKPLAIARHIGRRPILVAGNSDGDMAMLQWATAGAGPRLGLIVHHTDADREWAYDRESAVGRLDAALDAAPAAGWIVIDMAEDWQRIFLGEHVR